MRHRRLRTSVIIGVLVLIPAIAQAHSASGALNGWHDGFSHPLHGWDHLLAMLAVGVWAAQQRGRTVWMLPLMFVTTMVLGGIVGASGVGLPGVEIGILGSVFVLLLMVIGRARCRMSLGLALVGLFGFCHGFAHGEEMPGSASLVTFGCGFVLATAMLHGLGLLTARGVTYVLACAVGGSAMASESTNTVASATNEPVRLAPVVVTGRADSMIGVAETANQGTVGAEELATRPILRAGEVLETVPGVIITQHAGGGKANQYFLRGFNLDHGTDIAIDLDGMPLNLPSHAHGPGYSDFNIVIPELVQRINYEKGPYYAADGDFSSAAAGHVEFFKQLPQNFVTAEGGMYGYGRLAFGTSTKGTDGVWLVGGEAFHDDGPWVRPDDYQKFNGLVTYSHGDAVNGYSVTARAYHGKWNSSDQIAESAVSSGAIPFFGSLDDSTGGNSQRYSVQAEWHRADEFSATKVMAYGFYYDLDLFSDFTYFLMDTNRGDQFEQADKRWVAGLKASHTLFGHLFQKDTENTFGLQVRSDWVKNGLFQTENRVRTDKTENNPLNPDVIDNPALLGAAIPATTRRDDFNETSIGLYYENRTQWGEKLRSVVGVRGDIYYFDVTDFSQTVPGLVNPTNSGSQLTGVASPKGSLIFGPWAKTEFYVSGGFGFHSDDARGTTAHVNPAPDGSPTTPLEGLFQTKGAEVGIRTLAIPHLQSTLSLWYLHSDSELLFEGDTGTTVNSKQPSNRYGIEFANYWSPTDWLTMDLDYADSVARFTSPDEDGGTHVPVAIQQVLSAGVTLHDLHGFSASLRLRYFGPRDLVSTGAFKSSETILLNLALGYEFNKHWSIHADVFNLLDRRDHDIDYAYTSQISPSGRPQTEIHFHPVEPIQVRFAVTARF